MIVKEFKKLIWKKTILDNFLTYMLREKKLKFIKKKKVIWTYENMAHLKSSKSSYFFFKKFFW